MVPLARMRTLIVLATIGALSRNTLSGDAFLTHSPRPCRGDFGRNGTDASHGDAPAFQELLLRSANDSSLRLNEDFDVEEVAADQFELTGSCGGYETMELSNVYVVPEMKCRLLSSNWAWQHDNVSTHLNNDRFLRLPYLRRKSCATFASPELEVLKGEGSKTGRARRKRVAHGHVREAGRCLFQL